MLDSRIDCGATSRVAERGRRRWTRSYTGPLYHGILTDPAADSAEGKCNRKASGRLTPCSVVSSLIVRIPYVFDLVN
jgi:hypothetical protein